MIVPVSIHYRELEELCYYDDWEKGVVCDDYDMDHEYTVDQVEFDHADLEDIVDEYFDDIVDIILNDRRLVNALLEKMRSRRINVTTIDTGDEEKRKALKS
jgi:hypothetical protein